MKYKCTTKCFIGGRLWTPGEIYTPPGGLKPPAYFVEVKDAVLAPRNEVKNEPSTFAELQRIEAEQLKKSMESKVDDDFLK